MGSEKGICVQCLDERHDILEDIFNAIAPMDGPNVEARTRGRAVMDRSFEKCPQHGSAGHGGIFLAFTWSRIAFAQGLISS